MKRLIFCLVWAVLLGPLRGFCATDPPLCLFSNYTTLDGMVHDRIADIYTDSRGFVWVCTWYGVSCFDGYTFRNFSTMPANSSPLAHHRFISVSEDTNGHLWFMTYNLHIYRFNRFTEQFEDVAQLVGGIDPKHYRTTGCLHDRSGGTWVSIADMGAVRFVDTPDAAPVQVDAVFDEPVLGGSVRTMYVDDRDNAWIAAADGQLNFVASSASQRRARTVCETDEPIFAFVANDTGVYGIAPHAVVRAALHGCEAVVIPASGASLTAITTDSIGGGVVYAGNAAGELFRVEDDRLVRLSPVGRRPERIRALNSDSHGIVWVTTPEAGITRYNPASNDYKHFEQRPYTVSYNRDTLPRLAEKQGRLWIKMNKYGFGYYDRESDEVRPFYNDPARPDCRMTNAVVRFDVQDNVLWLSTYHERGLRKAVLLEQPADIFTLDSEKQSSLAGDVRALMNDRQGRLWVGTRDGELYCYDASMRLVYRHPMTQRGGLGMIYALKEDAKGNIWVGTKGRGLYRLKPDGNGYAVTAFRHATSDNYSLSSDNIYCIEEDRDGRIWIATYGGGIDLLESADSDRFLHAGNRMRNYPLDEAGRVRWLLCDRKNRMFAATVDGLLVFDPEAEVQKMRFRLVQNIPGNAASLGNNDIIHLYKDASGRVWLATYGGGVHLITGYDAQGVPQFRKFDHENGLSNDICMALTSDRQGDLWVSTLHCVSRFDPETERFANYPLYDDTHAAIFSEATAVSQPDGKVLFGSGRNIYRFDPEKMRALQVDYNLRFTGLDVRNRAIVPGNHSPLAKSISEASEIVLPHDFSNMRIEFAALNQAVQHTVGYRYKLEGYDRDWAFAGTSNSAFYSSLPVGDYRFRVKASTDSSDAGGEEIGIDVRVLPPPWLTWWAKSLYIIALFGVCFVVYRVASTMIRIRREVSVEQDMTDLKLRFFTNISHELRTPLTLILGGIEDVIKHDRLSSRGNISLALAHRNAKRMLSLVNQLLDFRKIVKNKMELKISRVNLVPLVEDALDDFREMASERKIDLLFTVSSRSILVWVDVERIESVVYNLLSNALKFTPERGKIEVILSLHEEEGCAKIVVRDTGIGIPKEKQEHIFERFAQAFRAVDPQMKGSGIGLSLCRDIVELHHGEISVESRPGHGSAFTVKLKLGNAHFGMEQIDFTAANGAADYMVSDYTSTGSQHRTDVQPPSDAQKILLVEDNRELRIFIYNSLIETYRVIEADDGVDALAKIHGEMPDIVVTDLMMPRMDGIELIDKVRHDFTISHIPIIMLTARHSPDDRVKAMEYGADGYITKPFSIELLLARIDNLLNQRRMLFEKYSTQSARNKVVELSMDDMVVTDRDEEFMKEVMAWLSEHIENSDLTIDQLAGHLGLGRTTMYNKLKSLTGKSPIELIKEFRITKAQLFLRTGQFSVSEVAYKVGFSDPGYFSRCFREICHMSPAEYLKTYDLKQKQ